MPIQLFPPSSTNLEPVCVDGQTLHIPCRVYLQPPPPHVVRALGETERLILACLLSRHYNGVERQRHVPQLLAASEDWVAPFVIQLVGEYVVEIIDVIVHRMDDLLNERYIRFAADNPHFIALTKRRVISYWNEYYRYRFPRFADYPGFKVMDALGLWSRCDAPRLLAR